MIGLFKTLHVSCAALSFFGFLIRGWWMARQSRLLQHRLTRFLPHVIDTLLLLSAIGLVWQYHLMPTQPWLLSKISALVAYVGFGTVALKRGKTLGIRLWAFALAVGCFLFIVSVAVYKSPWGFLALLPG